MVDKHLNINTYTYDLPKEKIAFTPLENRTDAKLLVYKNEQIQDTVFNQIIAFIPKNTLVVFNETKVVNARLTFEKESGGKIEIFCLEPFGNKEVSQAMLDKGFSQWKCLIGGLKKWKDKSESLYINHHQKELLQASFDCEDGEDFVITFNWQDESKTFSELLEKYGNIPLPPYINRAVNENDNTRYQTVFAKNEGSVAAPTASLHFSKELIQELKNNDVKIAHTTLHVGAGTFMPVKDHDLSAHHMHAEWMTISLYFVNTILQQLSSNQPILAVGTTACRLLESAYWLGVKLITDKEIDWHNIGLHQWECYELESEIAPIDAIKTLHEFLKTIPAKELHTQTQIIIIPGYEFKITDILITNFHQPASTLLLLVAAFIGDDYKQVYDYALTHNFRFLSYGDSSILFRKQQ